MARNTLTRKLQRQTTIVQWPTQHPHPETTTPNYDSTMAYATPSPGNYNANYDSTMAYATPSPGNYNAKLRQYNGLQHLTRKLQRQTTIVQWPTQHPHPETTTPNYDSTMAYATPSPGNYNAKLRQYNGLQHLTRKLQRQTTIVQWPTQHPHPETTTPNYDSTMAYATPSPGNYNAKLRQYNGLQHSHPETTTPNYSTMAYNILTRKLQRQTTTVQWPTQHPHPETTTPNYDSTMAYATPSPGNYNAKLRQYNGLQHPHPETTTPNYDSTMAYATPSPGNYNAKLR